MQGDGTGSYFANILSASLCFDTWAEEISFMPLTYSLNGEASIADTGALSTGIRAVTVSGDCSARTIAALAPLILSQMYSALQNMGKIWTKKQFVH